jgi:hypothetical protein
MILYQQCGKSENLLFFGMAARAFPAVCRAAFTDLNFIPGTESLPDQCFSD